MTTLLVVGQARCTAACYGASGPACDCVCEGRNHGVGWARAVEQAPELVVASTPGAVVVLGLPLTSAHDGQPATGARAAAAPPDIECAESEERRAAPGSLQVTEERPAPHTDARPEVDLRAPYTPDEWAAIQAALKAERERRAKRGAPFTQADQVAVAHAAVWPIREGALTTEAR